VVRGRPQTNRTIHRRTAPGCVLLVNFESFQTVSTPIGWHSTCLCTCKAYLELGDPIEDTVCTITDGCFERFWAWSRPKDMGRVGCRYSLRDKLPTNFDNDSGSCLCSPLRQARIKVRSLVRRSCLHFRTAVEGFEICCGKRQSDRRSCQ
jgi:hypothetical protein